MTTLDSYLTNHAATDTGAAIIALAAAAVRISAEIRAPRQTLDAAAGEVNADGDVQKALDVLADEIILAAVRGAGAAAYMSEERDEAIPLAPEGRVIVALSLIHI